jgi:hypothetical protein
MKKTLLEITQIILSKMDSDEVNSIGDTTESVQVAQEVENSYYELLGNISWSDRNNIISFEGVVDPDNKPNYLKIKELVDKFEFVMYNIGTLTDPEYSRITYLPPLDFLTYVSGNSSSGTTLVVTDVKGAKFPVKSDEHPKYYTSFDDEYLVFDSYNASVDDTLQESKIIAVGQVIPYFEQTDDFVPVMPAKYFPMLIAEASSMCFINHKGAPNSKEENRSRRQMVRHQNNSTRSDETQPRVPDYGRNR